MSTGLFMPVPEAVRRRVFSWISAGAEADDSLPEAALICAGSTDYVMRKAMPKSFTDHQLRSLDCPLLALRWVRSGMTWMEHESTIRSSSSRAPQPDGQQIAANARMVEQGAAAEFWPVRRVGVPDRCQLEMPAYPGEQRLPGRRSTAHRATISAPLLRAPRVRTAKLNRPLYESACLADASVSRSSRRAIVRRVVAIAAASVSP